jgi:hypothetical protein
VFRTTYGFDITSAKNPFYLGSTAAPDNFNGVARIAHRYNNMWLSENTLTYSHTAGQHTITALAGLTAQQSKLEGFGASTTRALNRWTPQNTNTDVPRALVGTSLNTEFSSAFIEDGSFLRARTVSLAYNWPKSLVSKLNLQNLRLYVSAQNLFTVTNYSGFDPEVSRYGASNTAPGHDWGGYPNVRTTTVGLNLTF